MTFFRGQRVVCIAEKFNPIGDWWFLLRCRVGIIPLPRFKKIYRVADIKVVRDETVLVLHEFSSRRLFSSSAFRPLVETKTDISVFERIRDRVNAKEIEEISDPVDVSFFAGHP